MSIPATPTTYLLQSGNGNAYLSWDQMSGATAYVVQRSQDNITFATLATITGTPLNNFYLDASGTAGTSYFYQVASQNGSGTSSYTASQQTILETPGIVNLADLRLQAQQRSDMVNSQFISTTEWNRMISQSCKELYDILIQKFGDDYYVASTYTYTTANGQQLYPLPADFYKLFLVEVALNPGDANSWVTIKKFERIQQNLWNYPNVYTFYGITNLRYRVDGQNLHIVPLPTGGQTLRLTYAPRPQVLMADTDAFDGISGWEEYVVVDAAIKACIKEETDASALYAQKKDLLKRIEEAAENRDIALPETVSDSQRTNFAWSEPGDYGSSGW